jgi:hypothetical protein
MNIHNRFRTIYFARVSFSVNSPFSFHLVGRSIHYLFFCMQSGQSLIEHSYKADSDLSPAGWDYAEKLKDFVLERRAKSLEQRGLDPSQRQLVVCSILLCEPLPPQKKRKRNLFLLFIIRSGPRLADEHIILHGLSFLPHIRRH